VNKEKDDYLCTTYPELFVERNLPMQQTCMCWGFECGDGWFNILNALCSNIQHHIDWSIKSSQRDIEYNQMIASAQAGDITKLEEYYSGWLDAETRMKETLEKGFRDVTPIVPQVVVEQVKEKFGTLRFYYRGGDDYVRGLVRMAEAMTSYTCEDCGSPAKTGGQGWLRTICTTCEDARETRRAEYMKENGLEE
jgi:hypothetical protein